MFKSKWFVLAAVLFVFVGIGVTLVLAWALGLFFAENQEAAATGLGAPIYQSSQTASSRAGYRHSTLTCGSNVFVNDYQEACLQLATTEPNPVIGRYGFGNGKICAVPGQPVSAYIAGDVGSEMPAHVPYRSANQPPFDWRTATFREMTADRPGWVNQYLTTTNTALLAEVVGNLRDGPPAVLPPFPFTAVTNLTNLKITIDQLPGLLFCPSVYVATNGAIYLAESLVLDTSSAQPQLNARWVSASPMPTLWLKSK